jgi:microcompartment protein CcmL/EutN
MAQGDNPDIRMSSLGVVETLGLLPLVEATDAMLKAANVEVVRWEKIGLGWAICCIAGSVGAVRASVEAGHRAADRLTQTGIASDAMSRVLGGPLPFPALNSCLLANPAPQTWEWVLGKPPSRSRQSTGNAIGYVEVLGFVSAILALDLMLKGANVNFTGYGGIPPRYVLWAQGDVGAVRTAVEAASAMARDGGRFVSSDIMARPEVDTAETIPSRYEIRPITGFSLALPHRLRLSAPVGGGETRPARAEKKVEKVEPAEQTGQAEPAEQVED